MMSPEGASSSNHVEIPGPQQAEVVGQPATLVKVSVPTGAVPGQQINFTMPNGQRVSTSVQEQVQPGATLTVSVPSPAPAAMAVAAPTGSAMLQPGLAQARETLLPQPVVNASQVDRMKMGWVAFGLSFLACCLCGLPMLPIALCIWSVVAMSYFCKPREERDRNPLLYAPACASAVTAGILCCCTLLAGLGALFVFALCGPFDMDHMDKMDSCPGLEKWINSTHMDHHHHWHPKWMSKNHMDHHHHWHPHWLRGSFHHESPPPTVSSPVFFDKAVEEEALGRPIPMGQHTIEEAAGMVAAAGAAPQSQRDEASTAVSSPAVAAVASSAGAPAMPAMWF
ncbi:unnamed protein product [Symbiodinium sp. CCMP2456]|nr:unnamed protein product [Symbiodinium sp. CCMP2456]